MEPEEGRAEARESRAPRRDDRGEIVRTLAAVCIVVASLKLASDFLAPLLLAAFFAMALAPLAERLQRAGVPAAVSTVLAFVLGAALVIGLLAFVGLALAGVEEKLPEYEERLRDRGAEATAWLQSRGVQLSERGPEVGLSPERALELASGFVASLGGALSNAVVILLMMLLLLFERAAFTGKAPGSSLKPGPRVKIQKVVQAVADYLSVKTVVSLLTGLLFGLACALIGVDFPLLWGLLAFLLNYIPNIGSVLAVTPAVLVALLQLGLDGALAAVVASVLVNGIMGNVVEPRLMGQKVGLSTLTIFVSLIFWSWIFGAVGTVLSVPLSIAVRTLLEKPAAADGPVAP